MKRKTYSLTQFNKQLEDLAKVYMDHYIQLNQNTYAVISLPKTIDGTRAYTYSLVNIETGKAESSFCQFDDYSDMLLNMSLHHKLGFEDEMLWNATVCLIEGRKKNNKDSQINL